MAEQVAGLVRIVARQMQGATQVRAAQLQEAMETCAKASAAADFPLFWPEVLAGELRQRLGYADTDRSDRSGTNRPAPEQ